MKDYSNIKQLDESWQHAQTPNEQFKIIALFRSEYPRLVSYIHLFYTVFMVNLNHTGWKEIYETELNWTGEDEDFFKWLEDFKFHLKHFGVAFRDDKPSGLNPRLARETMLTKLYSSYLNESEFRQIYVMSRALIKEKSEPQTSAERSFNCETDEQRSRDFDRLAASEFKLILPTLTYIETIANSIEILPILTGGRAGYQPEIRKDSCGS